MFKRILAIAAALTASQIALAQGVAVVDLFDPSKWGIFPPPAHVRIVDVYFDVAATDVWTAAGMRVLAENGASIVYFDRDPNTPGLQPGLFSGGVVNKWTTMLSKPRPRDGAARFTNAGADAAGSYDHGGAGAITAPSQLNVAYFASPPESAQSPAVDGYIARIAVDISNVPPIPGNPIDDYANWNAGPLDMIPAGALLVLRSTSSTQPGGTATATWDVPALNFTNWALWYVPEPTSLALLALGGLAAIRRR